MEKCGGNSEFQQGLEFCISLYWFRLKRAATFHGENMGNKELGTVQILALECWDHDRRSTCTSCHGNTVPGLAETLWSCTAAEQVIECSLIPECSNVYTCCIIIYTIYIKYRCKPCISETLYQICMTCLEALKQNTTSVYTFHSLNPSTP